MIFSNISSASLKKKSVLLNRSISAISLKEIGEMNCYSKILHAKHSFLASLKGLPDEVNLILLNNDVSNKVLKITENNTIHIFKWDEKIDDIYIPSNYKVIIKSIIKKN